MEAEDMVFIYSFYLRKFASSCPNLVSISDHSTSSIAMRTREISETIGLTGPPAVFLYLVDNWSIIDESGDMNYAR
jgi:hypothetical protein